MPATVASVFLFISHAHLGELRVVQVRQGGLEVNTTEGVDSGFAAASVCGCAGGCDCGHASGEERRNQSERLARTTSSHEVLANTASKSVSEVPPEDFDRGQRA